MPWIILPNGRRIYTEKSISPNNIDDFLEHELNPQPSADDILTDAKKSLITSQEEQAPAPQLLRQPQVNPELHRKDTQMFDINYNDIDNWISNKASKLPAPLQKPAAMLGSALVNVPSDFITSILGAPETPALMGAGGLKRGLESIAPSVEQAVTHEPLGLPPSPFDRAPAPRYSDRQFTGAQSGGSGQVIDSALAEKDPSLFARVIGNSKTPAAQSTDLDQLREADRIANLNYTGAKQYPGSTLKLPDKQLPIPPESGDTRGGFQPQTNQEMSYPYNVLPNLIRPRASQSEVLSSTALRDLDLSKPVESGSNIHFISGGPDNPIWPIEDTESTPTGYFGTGQPVVNDAGIEIAPAQAQSAPRPPGPWDNNPAPAKRNSNLQNDIFENASKKFNMGRPLPVKKPLDIINSSPVKVTDISGINRIPPGQADVPPMLISGPNGDISAFRAHTSSPHIVMDNFPESKSVIGPILDSNDEKYKWLATVQREFANISKGLNTPDRKSLTYILNGEEVPGASPDLYARAAKAKNLLDSVWDLANDKSDEGLGFIDRYITHIKAQPDDIRSAISSIVENQFGKESGLYKFFSGGTAKESSGKLGDYFDRGMGNPNSPFTKERMGGLQDIETDYNKIMPVYLESMAKVIHDKPAIDQAMEGLKGIDEGKLKEYLTGYIKNYSRYDADAQLAKASNALVNQIATTNARSVISFNPLVHAYHLGQLPANVWPELGTKYSLLGTKEFLSHPIQSYQELAKNGLFSNMIRPMSFQTPVQKFDSISYFMNLVESIVKGTGYYGFKQQALDSGMNELDSTMHAIQQIKNATATVDPARHMRYFTPESNWFGGQGSRLIKQYHQIPAKLVEQFAHAAADFKDDPAKLARYIAGTAIAGVGAEAGLHTLHISPGSQALAVAGGGGGQFARVMSNIFRYLGKGDVVGALKQAAEWVTPAGATIKKGMKLAVGEE